MLLFIDPNGGTAYDTVICLKSVSITDSVASIDISSWCGPGKLPGLNDITLSFDGYHVQDNVSGSISGTDFRILLRNKTTIGWKLSPENPQSGDEIQSGIGFIDSLSSTYSFDNVGGFNFTINVKGEIASEIIPSYTLTIPLVSPVPGESKPYVISFGFASATTVYVYSIFGDDEYNATYNPGTNLYEVSISGNSAISGFTLNINFTNINDLASCSVGGPGFNGYMCTYINLYGFPYIQYIELSYNELSAYNCNNILQSLVNYNIYSGSLGILTQFPSVILNSSLISTLTSRFWFIY